jgi:hypothetical protein
MKLWDARTGSEEQTLSGVLPGVRVYSVCASPRSHLVFSSHGTAVQNDGIKTRIETAYGCSS